jgi:hypothetical protein
MVERERAIAESDAKHLLWNLIFKCLTLSNPTVYSDGRLQIANLPPLVQRKLFQSSRRANLNIAHRNAESQRLKADANLQRAIA